MNNQPAIRSVAIVGAGLIGWTAAATLASALKAQGVKLLVVNDPVEEPGPAIEVGRFGMRRMHDIIGLDERHLLATTHGAFSLGVEWTGYGGKTFIHPFGEHGISPNPIRFEQGFIKRRRSDQSEAFSDYFLAAQAAKAGKFAFPDPDPRSILSTLNPGVHVNTERYRQYLQAFSQRLGVEYLTASIDRIVVGSNGFIKRLALSDGSSVAVDFYIDCTGAHSRLLGKALKVPFQSWRQWLPSKRIATLKRPATSAPMPLTRCRAHPWGWHRVAQAQFATGHEWVYDPGRISIEQLLEGLGDGPSADAHQVADVAINAGRREVFWQNNCLALGMAGGCVDPIALSNLHWTHSALILFLDCLPDRDCLPSVRQEFNRLCGETLERLRDFQQVHAILLQPSEPNALVPESLSRRLELFRHRGRLLPYENDVVPVGAWEALLLSAGVLPKQYEPAVDTIPEHELLEQQRKIKQAIQRALEKLPSHAQVLARYCPPSRN